MSVEVTNLRQLSKNFERIAQRIGVDVVTFQKKLAFDIFADIVAQTPVDTGRAMNNWNISVNVPDRSTTKTGGKKGSIRGVKKGEALTTIASLRPFSTVWISNSLPYIVFLNEGSSDKAPAGWVDRAVFNNLASLGSVL